MRDPSSPSPFLAILPSISSPCGKSLDFPAHPESSLRVSRQGSLSTIMPGLSLDLGPQYLVLDLMRKDVTGGESVVDSEDVFLTSHHGWSLFYSSVGEDESTANYCLSSEVCRLSHAQASESTKSQMHHL